jgi:hypothetical protein
LQNVLQLEQDKIEKVDGPNVGGVTSVTASKKKVYNVTLSSEEAKSVGMGNSISLNL